MIEVLSLLFLTALLSPFIVRVFKHHGAAYLSLIPLICFCYFSYAAIWVANFSNVVVSIPWFNEIGVNLSFYLDGLSLLFANLITGIGTLIVFYSASYLKDHPFLNRYCGYLFLFMSAMLCLVLASNLITLFIFWELTAISSYLLIGFDNARPAARDAALKALLVTGAGGLSLLVGFILIGMETNSYDLVMLLQYPDVLRENSWYTVILILILLGAFTKSAQFPFHFWLPAAMEAPTPVSAYLHSATMVQAGIYLLARFHPLLSGTPLWFGLLTAFGGITMIGGVLLALRENDIKLILAYTTISALGSLTYLLASDQEGAIKACVGFIFAHALYKAALFLAAGNIQKETGTRELHRMHGLFHTMPATFFTVLIAASSMGGLPPLLGFYVKELVYETRQVVPFFSQVLTVLVVLTNMMLMMLAFILVLKPFWGKKKMKSHEPDFSMWFSGLSLALITLFFGLFPFFMSQNILSPAASAILHHPVKLNLELWHGFTPSFMLSLVTFLGGALLYLQQHAVLRTINYFKFALYHGPELAYVRILQFIVWFADTQTRLIQNGRLAIYLTVTLSTIAVVLGVALINTPLNFSSSTVPFSWFSIFLLIWLLISATATAIATQLIVAVIYLGAFGMGVALFFLVNAAPDVAMTQVLVETLFVIIFVLTLYKLPQIPTIDPLNENRFLFMVKMSVSIAVGLIITILLLAVIGNPVNTVVSDYFINNSVNLGHGRNIVNVILVDFRAFDTLGEAIVLVIAALGVHGLLKRKIKGTWL